jgi:hypothetical protein
MTDDTNDREWEAMIKRAMDAEPLAELDHDLWPRMQARLAQRARSVTWVDLVLLAAVVLMSVAFPQVLLGMFYHL